MRFSSVGVSLFASLFSIITYTAIPGEMINKGPVALCWMLGLPVIFVVVGLVLIPRIMALPVTSGYELLEKRLGLKFVPVPGTRVLFSVWDTRVQDYAAYAATSSGVDGVWRSPGFEQGETHLAQRVGDISFRQLAVPAQVLEYRLQFL